MGVMLYKQGSGTRVWGKEYQSIIVDEADVDAHKEDGWHSHPDEVKGEGGSQEMTKRTRKPKAAEDADSD